MSSSKSSSAVSSSSAPVAVVTGAGSGIGRALAIGFAKKGWRIALGDVNMKGLEETVSLLQWPNSVSKADIAGQVYTQKLDVADRDAVHKFAETVIAKFGAPDAVINNAGVAVSETIEHLKYEDLDWLMGINFFGVVSGTKAFLPSMLLANKGCIVNVSSIFGIIAVPSQSAYNASKFAVRGFTEALQWELAARGPECGVWSMCVLPGGVATNVARSARFYTSPDGNTDRSMAHAKFDSVAHTTPEQAAAQILGALTSGGHQKRLLIGHDAKTLWCLQRVLPGSYWQVLRGLEAAGQFAGQRKIQVQNLWAWAAATFSKISGGSSANNANNSANAVAAGSTADATAKPKAARTAAADKKAA